VKSTQENNSGDDLYFAANDSTPLHHFDGGITFQGEEAFARLDATGKPQQVSLAGSGSLTLPQFRMDVQPLLQKPLQVLEIANAPLRLRVDAPLSITQHLPGALIRLHRSGMARPFALLIQSATAAPG